MIDFEALSIQQFLGMILIFPIYIYISLIFIEFIARIRDFFRTSDRAFRIGRSGRRRY